MGTPTELFGVIPVKSSRRMERIHGSKHRALILGYRTRESDTDVTTKPIKTCWVVRQEEELAIQRLQGLGESRRNSNIQFSSKKTSNSQNSTYSGDDGDNCKRTVEPPSVRQFPSHVFRESSLIFLILISIFSTYLIRPGNGLHPPPQCQWSLYEDIERLNCVVEAGHSLNIEEEIHGIGPEHAKSLWVQCQSSSSDSASLSDSSYLPSSSSLEVDGVQQQHHHHHHQSDNSGENGDSSSNNANLVITHRLLMAFSNLKDLRLENCHVSGISIPGVFSHLPYLQNLTIRADTSLSSRQTFSSLEIKTVHGLPALKKLDLSTTNVGSLPVCQMRNLEHLNLSSCFLRDFHSIGIVPEDPTKPDNCENSVKKLDISNNFFTLLPPATFAALNKLEELRIEKNSITIAAERALLGLTSLRVFSLAQNQITSLPPLFFKDNRLLQEIYLQNNSLSVLAPGLFAGLKHLVVLDLSNNQLTSEWINGDSETFRGLDNLFALNLANNELTKIDNLLLKDLRYLQMLNLENNRISYIAEGAFSMPNLYTLVLSHNHLKKVDTFICNGVFGLSFLSMDNNKIEKVEPDSFKNCSGLQDLNLSGNRIKEVPQALNVLNQLRTLDLGENNITKIDALENFENLRQLYGLRLTGNHISSIPNSFANLPALKIVNFAKNNISHIAPGSFDNNTNLQAIRLDSNRISDITGLFKNIPNLLWLNISANQLEEFKYEELNARIQWVDARSNRIKILGKCDTETLRIRNLDLSNNYITEISSGNLPDDLEYVDLSFNLIQQIQPYALYRKKNLTRINLSSNQLVRIDQNSLRLGPDREDKTRQVFLSLANNPLICDCQMSFLQDINNNNNNDISGHYPIIQDEVKCTLAFDKIQEPISYLDIQPSQFLCKYESHCFKTCQCCEYEACDCKSSCPKNCSCYHDQAWGNNLVDCSNNQQNYIGNIPMDSTELYLDGNIFTSLESHSFIGRKNLRKLYLNASHVEVIQQKAFHGLKNLKILHLESNFIEKLDGFEFDDIGESLEELYLHQNSLAYIANETFSSFYRLKILTLHENNFVNFEVWRVTTRIGRLGYTLSEITVSGNDWACDCQFATTLKEWLIEYREKVTDAENVHCIEQVSSNVGANGQNRNQTELMVIRLLDQKNHRCTSPSSQSTDLSSQPPIHPSTDEPDEFNLAEYVPWLVCIPIVLIILIIIIILSYYWRQSLRLWLHSHLGIRLSREPTCEMDKLFDVFVSYSSKDEAWVRQVLATGLETHNNPPYRLCLRYRDLPANGSGTYIADTIVQASEASRRTILVLSHHFLKGEWSRTDVKSAHHSVLKDRHRKVIIILLGDLPSKDLDPDIRLYLKNHTYLNCDDKKFWEKLRYALPDVKVKAPVFRGIHGRNSSSRNSSQQHRSAPNASTPASGTPLQPQNHHLHHSSAAHHHHYSQPSPNMSQAHHLTHLGPNTQNNITSPLIGPPPPLTAPPVPGLLANLPPNIPNGTIGPTGHPHHGALHGGGPVTTVIGGGGGFHGGSTASISTSSNNSGSQRAPQRHPSLVNSAHHPNSRQNTAIHI